jgi:hypothetical protein
MFWKVFWRATTWCKAIRDITTISIRVLLGAIAKFPSVRMDKFGSQWVDFHKLLYLSTFRNSVQEIQVLWKSDKKNGHFT